MIVIIQQLFFLISLSLAGFFLWKRITFIRRNILLGTAYSVSGQENERIKNMLLMAFGQKKMFSKPLVGVMHFCLYVGFFIINVEVLEIILDGLFGTHRLFFPILGNFYVILINAFEFLAVLVLVSCIVFLARRNILKIKRFWSNEMTSWPRNDANYILLIEIFLMSAFLFMNAADTTIQNSGDAHYPKTGGFVFSSILVPLIDDLNLNTLIVVERVAWWLHILGILFFAVYVTYSKHLHIFLAFPNTYYARLSPAGEMHNIDSITNEVKLALGLGGDGQQQAPEKFGAKDATDLNWKQLMEAYSCTECGRCTSVCPANATGKVLSPRKIMMDVRDRITEIGNELDNGRDINASTKTLLGSYISKEEILACTSCNACVEACPIQINPLDIILELRRNMVMEEASAPGSWNSMFANIENNAAPWAFSQADRANWRETESA